MKRLDPQVELGIYRACIRYRNQQHGRRHFCHEGWARPAFMLSIVALRKELRGSKSAASGNPSEGSVT